MPVLIPTESSPLSPRNFSYQPTNQSTNHQDDEIVRARSASRSPNPPTNQSTNPSTDPSTALSVDHSVDQPTNQSTNVTYDELLTLCGTGRFHYQLLALCGWANASDAIEILSASFLMASINQSDDPTVNTISLTDSEKGWLAAVIFIGMLVGGYVWGSAADRIGRKIALICALVINFLGGFMCSLTSDFTSLLFCRLIAGLGVGGSIPIIFTYFIEFLPMATRGQFMVYLSWFWMVGAIFTAGTAWIILPMNIDAKHMHFLTIPVQSWRLFAAVCSLPSLICAVFLLGCPESPQFHLTQKKIKSAQQTIYQMYRINHDQSSWFHRLCGLCCSMKETFNANDHFDEEAHQPIDPTDSESIDPVNKQKHFEHRLALLDWSNSIAMTDDESIDPIDIERSNSNDEMSRLTDSGTVTHSSTNKTIQQSLQHFFKKTTQLFTKQYLNQSIKLFLIWFGFSFGYYGLTLWVPETLARTHRVEDQGLDMYSGAFLSAACNLPGNILSVYTVRTLGRAKTLGSSIALSTITIGLVPLADTTLSVTIVLSLFSIVSVSAWNALNISTTELYPSAIRSTAFGVFAAAGRLGAILGNVLFGQFIGYSVAVPMIISAGCLAVSTVAAWRLKETKDEVLR